MKTTIETIIIKKDENNDLKIILNKSGWDNFFREICAALRTAGFEVTVEGENRVVRGDI